MHTTEIKALTFDVFGTVVDYFSTIVREGAELNRAKSLNVDWARFALSWRGRYAPSMQRVGRGELPWTNLDALHHMALEEVLAEFKIDVFSEEEKAHLNRIWHRLQPWPDSVAGLTRLRERYTIATLSNGNVALLVDMAKYSNLPWDCILSAELAKAYKPDPKVYQMAADLLGLPTSQVMMVAAHQDDLLAAKALGLKAAFVPRPLEFGPNSTPEPTSDPSFDIVATDLLDLAHQLGT